MKKRVNRQPTLDPIAAECGISAGNMVYPSSGTYKMARTLKLCTEMAYGVVVTVGDMLS